MAIPDRPEPVDPIGDRRPERLRHRIDGGTRDAHRLDRPLPPRDPNQLDESARPRQGR
jgi:hypothetical protein